MQQLTEKQRYEYIVNKYIANQYEQPVVIFCPNSKKSYEETLQLIDDNEDFKTGFVTLANYALDEGYMLIVKGIIEQTNEPFYCDVLDLAEAIEEYYEFGPEDCTIDELLQCKLPGIKTGFEIGYS